MDKIEWQHLHHQQVKTDCGSLQAKLSQCEQDLKKMPSSCPSCTEKTAANASPSQPCDTPYFKKLARTILGHIEDYGSYEVKVTASEDDSSTLEKFVSSDKGNVQDVSEVIIGILTNFKSHQDVFGFSKWDTSTLSYLTREAILLSVAFILVICAVVIFEMRTNLSWRSQLWLVLLVSFIISIPWEWYRLYRKAFASKQAQMAKANEIPKGCLPDHELRPWESFKLWFSSSFTFSDDICTRYQETLLVDPFWEVSPSKVSSFVFYSVQQLCFVYSYFERGCRIKCMQQYQKVLWVVLSSLFFKKIWKNGTRGHGRVFANTKGKQQKKVQQLQCQCIDYLPHYLSRLLHAHFFRLNLPLNSCFTVFPNKR